MHDAQPVGFLRSRRSKFTTNVVTSTDEYQFTSERLRLHGAAHYFGWGTVSPHGVNSDARQWLLFLLGAVLNDEHTAPVVESTAGTGVVHQFPSVATVALSKRRFLDLPVRRPALSPGGT